MVKKALEMELQEQVCYDADNNILMFLGLHMPSCYCSHGHLSPLLCFAAFSIIFYVRIYWFIFCSYAGDFTVSFYIVHFYL